MSNFTKIKDIGIRAAKTFAQAFLGAMVIDGTMLTADGAVWRSMLLAATAAGISAVWNLLLAAVSDDLV